ncbi:hypothetical protein ACQ1ZK_20645, partial [Enterococcus faecium]
GSFAYERTFTVDPSVVDAFEAGTAVLVVHGIDPGNSGAYDGEAMSDLDPELRLEATAPAACGTFTASQMGQMPAGGAETGAG